MGPRREQVERALDLRARLVEIFVPKFWIDAVGFERDHRIAAELFQLCSQRIAIVSLVGQKTTRLTAIDQAWCRLAVMSLPLGQLEGHRQSKRIHHQVYFGC